MAPIAMYVALIYCAGFSVMLVLCVIVIRVSIVSSISIVITVSKVSGVSIKK